jgi:hypothetical protein
MWDMLAKLLVEVRRTGLLGVEAKEAQWVGYTVLLVVRMKRETLMELLESYHDIGMMCRLTMNCVA